MLVCGGHFSHLSFRFCLAWLEDMPFMNMFELCIIYHDLSLMYLLEWKLLELKWDGFELINVTYLDSNWSFFRTHAVRLKSGSLLRDMALFHCFIGACGAFNDEFVGGARCKQNYLHDRC